MVKVVTFQGSLTTAIRTRGICGNSGSYSGTLAGGQHKADEIEVTVGGTSTSKSLQAAINDEELLYTKHNSKSCYAPTDSLNWKDSCDRTSATDVFSSCPDGAINNFCSNDDLYGYLGSCPAGGSTCVNTPTTAPINLCPDSADYCYDDDVYYDVGSCPTGGSACATPLRTSTPKINCDGLDTPWSCTTYHSVERKEGICSSSSCTTTPEIRDCMSSEACVSGSCVAMSFSEICESADTNANACMPSYTGSVRAAVPRTHRFDQAGPYNWRETQSYTATIPAGVTKFNVVIWNYRVWDGGSGGSFSGEKGLRVMRNDNDAFLCNVASSSPANGDIDLACEVQISPYLSSDLVIRIAVKDKRTSSGSRVDTSRDSINVYYA